MGSRVAVCLEGLLACLAVGRLAAQGAPIRHGSIQIAGSAQLAHTRDIGTDRGRTLFEMTPRLGYFVADGIAASMNLQFRRVSEGSQSTTGWGVGPGLTYYVNMFSPHFYPFLSGRSLFTWDQSGLGPSGIRTKGTSRVWLVSGGGLVMIGQHVGITGELFYQRERFTSQSGVGPRLTSNSETYGIQWGVAAFIF